MCGSPHTVHDAELETEVLLRLPAIALVAEIAPMLQCYMFWIICSTLLHTGSSRQN